MFEQKQIELAEERWAATSDGWGPVSKEDYCTDLCIVSATAQLTMAGIGALLDPSIYKLKSLKLGCVQNRGTGQRRRHHAV